MSLELGLGVFDAVDGGLRKDGLAKRGDELTQQAPAAGLGQTASAQCGESSSSSMNGSSSRMIRR